MEQKLDKIFEIMYIFSSMLIIRSVHLSMQFTRQYEIMILLTEEFNDSELKSWVFNYAKNLRKFNVSEISVISRGKHKLSYQILEEVKGSYIQLNFSSIPKYIEIFLKNLMIDSKVLRYLITTK